MLGPAAGIHSPRAAPATTSSGQLNSALLIAHAFHHVSDESRRAVPLRQFLSFLATTSTEVQYIANVPYVVVLALYDRRCVSCA
jgi:hypothetical protein